jgi:H+/gluconate symporter-like permease
MLVSISILIGAVLLLLLLIALLRLSPFIALIVVAILTGLAKNMPLETLLKSIQNGIGATLGGLVMVLGFGVILGAILSESGAAKYLIA